MNPPKVLHGEPDLGHWLATHTTNTRGRFPIEGRLWLTSTRLVFVPPPVYRLVRRWNWSCLFGEIVSVDAKPVQESWTNHSPKRRLAIETSGGTHFFVVSKLDEVLLAINQAMAASA